MFVAIIFEYFCPKTKKNMFDDIKTQTLDQIYDGSIHHLNVYTNHCYNEGAPFGINDLTNIEITHNKHDMNLVNKNFLNVTARVGLTFNRALGFRRTYRAGTTAADITTPVDDAAAKERDVDLGHSPIWVGWKNSGEIITEMQVLNRGRETGYHNIHQDRDNYIENTKYTTKTHKEIHPECHLDTNSVHNTTGQHPSPGIVIRTEDYLTNLVQENIISFIVEYPIINNEVIIIDGGLRTLLAGVAGTNFQPLIAAQMQILLGLLAKGTYRFPRDVMFHFKVKKNAASKYLDAGNHTYDTEQEVYDAWRTATAATAADRTPQFADAATNVKYDFVDSREYGIKPGEKYTVNIPLTIPIKDFACFKSMSRFERIFGDITLRLMFGPRSMVYSVIGETYSTQIGLQTGSWGIVDVVDFKITALSCDCFGYNMSPELLEQTKAELSGEDMNDTRIYQTRYHTFKNFDSQMISGRYDMDFPYPLMGVKDIHIVFPTSAKSRTIFMNPILKDMQLKIDGILYPKNEALRTDDGRFYYMQIMDLEADNSLKYSYSCKQINPDGSIMTYADKSYDDTNFIATWNLMAGKFMVYDPIGNDNVNIHFYASVGHNVNDYYGRDNTGAYDDNLPSPQIWFTSDAGWSLSYKDGLTFNRCVSFMGLFDDLNSSKLFYI